MNLAVLSMSSAGYAITHSSPGKEAYVTNNPCLNLCLVTQVNDTPLDQYLDFLNSAVKGGITSVQLRDKHSSMAYVRHLALEIKSLLATHHIPLIINDRIDLALEIDADGIHLGQSDMTPEIARIKLGSKKIIGLSIESFDELEKANQLNCIDYIAASAVFPSQNKQDCKTIWGLKGLRNITQRAKHPVVAIGGISQHTVGDVMAQGACGVAVIGAIHNQQNPFLAARELIRTINQEKSHVSKYD